MSSPYPRKGSSNFDSGNLRSTHPIVAAKDELSWLYQHGDVLTTDTTDIATLQQQAVTLNNAIDDLNPFRSSDSSPQPVKQPPSWKSFNGQAHSTSSPRSPSGMYGSHASAQSKHNAVTPPLSSPSTGRSKQQQQQLAKAEAMQSLISRFKDNRKMQAEESNELERTRALADIGDVKAMFALAECYAKGEGVAQNEAEAVEWYRKAARKSHVESMVKLGEAYEYGRGVPKDEIEALKWFTDAADSGDGSVTSFSAKNKLGEMYSSGVGVPNKDKQKAFSLFQESNKGGCVDATYNLAMCYYNGEGVDKWVSNAASFFEKAAKEGHRRAMCMLGWLYHKGEAVQRMPAKAAELFCKAGDVEWSRKAADDGNEHCMLELAYCYETGDHGIERDLQQAIVWYEKATKRGITSALYSLAECYDILKEPKNSFKWCLKAAEADNKDAMYRVAKYLENGVGVKPDQAKAAEWYQKAASQGHAGALFHIGVCQMEGTNGSVNIPEGLLNLTAAANKQHRDAMVRLGMYYENVTVDKRDGNAKEAAKVNVIETKNETKKNEVKNKEKANEGQLSEEEKGRKNKELAVDWYQKAADLGSAFAMYRLGVCYENGIGVSVNASLAIEMYHNAAALDHIDAMEMLGRRYFYGKNMPEKDESKGIEWFAKAAALGNSASMCRLGVYYINGTGGLLVDETKGVDLLRQSAELGNARAMRKLGDCYEKGIGVLHASASIADEWHRKAAKLEKPRADRNDKKYRHDRDDDPDHSL